MTRYALLVDAGYLWATAGETLVGTTERADLQPSDEEGLLQELIARCSELADDRDLLRVYWYDAAVNRVPSIEQARIAELADVKLRLGRMVGGRQKGVDALLLLDLVRLAANRSADLFFLFAGDEDLSEAVREAQASGARVLLMTVAGRQKDSMAETMRAEADGVVLIQPERLELHIVRRAPPSSHGQLTSAAPARLAQVTPDWLATATVDFVEAGASFGRKWRSGTGVADWARVLQGRPLIPRDLDADLLKTASGGEQLLESQRVSLREGFWAAMDETDR